MDAPTSADARPRFTIELCGNKAGYEVSPLSKQSLSLGSAEVVLRKAGFSVLTNAGILLVAQLGPVEVSVFESGRLLLKTKDKGLAERVTVATYDALGVAV